MESNIDFDPDVAVQVYTVALTQELLDLAKEADRETYKMLTTGIMHTYNISLVKGEEKVQHSAPVVVHIPIPEDLRSLALAGNVSVYRIEENGSLTDMHAVVDNGAIRFETNHFSLYAITETLSYQSVTSVQALVVVLLAATVLAVSFVTVTHIKKKRKV